LRAAALYGFLQVLLVALALAAPAEARDYPRYPAAGSTYVPLDSWIYPALERLAALGYIHTQFAGIRPWTRLECARLIDEAGERVQQEDMGPAEAIRLYRALEKEFAEQLEALGGGRNRGLRLESLYTRFTGIGGTPLTDGFHFGQTIVNDYGRPYREGANVVAGFSARGVAGRFAVYVRGEYQHAPSSPALSEQARNVIAAADSIPVQPATPFPAVNQFRLLDTYVAVNLENWQVAFGKQSLWWGPGSGGPLLFSNNAQPIYMLRISRAMPFKLPSVFAWLGPVRTEFFVGKLSGHRFPPRPFVHGQKFSFKPTQNLEFGFSRTVIFGGVGHPLTFRSLGRSLFNIQGRTPGDDPGDRREAFDISYQFGGWLSLYSNFMWDDAIRRTTMNPGFYLPRLPRLTKLDFRAEMVSTDVPAGPDSAGRLIYSNNQYHDAYTNKGNLLGSWVGRQGVGFQLRSTYWLSPRSSVQLNYRHAKVNGDFIRGGGTLNDIGTSAHLVLRPDLILSSYVQYERWSFPVLSTNRRSNVTASFQLTFWPQPRSQ